MNKLRESQVPGFAWSVEAKMRACCSLVDGECSKNQVGDVDCDDCLFYDNHVTNAQRRQFQSFCESTGLFGEKDKKRRFRI